jgi:hypothetical protein
MTNEQPIPKCPWCGAEGEREVIAGFQFVTFSCGSQIGDDDFRFQSLECRDRVIAQRDATIRDMVSGEQPKAEGGKVDG